MRGDSGRNAAARRGRRQGLTFALGQFDPVFDDRAKFAIDGDFVLPVTTGADNAGTLSDERGVFVRPFDDFDESGGVVHDWLSEIDSRTTRSW